MNWRNTSRSTARLIGALAVVLVIGATLGITTYLKPKAEVIVNQPCLITRTVSVVADRREATVTPSQTGRFKFTITPSTDAITPIEFDISGTASRADYTVTPENAQDLNFDVSPATGTFKTRSGTFYAVIAIANPQQYIDRTVIVTLRNKPGIVVGSASTATVRLYNPDPGKPSITIDNPLDNAHFTSSPNLQVNLTAHFFVPTNTTGSQSVTFYVDGTAYPATVSGQNATYTLNNPALGPHTVSAQLKAGPKIVNNDDPPIPPGQQRVDFVVDAATPSPSPSVTPNPGGTPTSVPVGPGAFLPTRFTNFMMPKAQAQAPAPVNDGMICGIVTDVSTGRPLADIKVEFDEGNRKRTTRTDVEGYYSFAGLYLGVTQNYSFEVGRGSSEYVSTVRASDGKKQHNIESAPVGTRINFALVKGGFISGIISSPDGHALPAISVEIVIDDEIDVDDGRETVDYVETNPLGEYRSAPLPLTRIYKVSTYDTLNRYANSSAGNKRLSRPAPGTRFDITLYPPGKIFGTLSAEPNIIGSLYVVLVSLSTQMETLVGPYGLEWTSSGDTYRNFVFPDLPLDDKTKYRLEVRNGRSKNSQILASKSDIVPSQDPGTQVDFYLIRDKIESIVEYETTPYTMRGCGNVITINSNQCAPVGLRKLLVEKLSSNVATWRTKLKAPRGASLTIGKVVFYPPNSRDGKDVSIFLGTTKADSGVTRNGSYLSKTLANNTYRVVIDPKATLNYCAHVLYRTGAGALVNKYIKFSGPAIAFSKNATPGDTVNWSSWGDSAAIDQVMDIGKTIYVISDTDCTVPPWQPI